MMKKIKTRIWGVKAVFIPVFLLILPFQQIFSQDENSLDAGNFTFYFTTKIIEDGSLLAAGVNWEYKGDFNGKIAFTREKTDHMEDWFWNLPDALLSYNNVSYDFYIYPLEYKFLDKPAIKMYLSGGALFSYAEQIQKGYFDDPILREYGYEHLNILKGDYQVWMLGPAVDAGLIYRGSDWIKAAISVNSIPVFIRWQDTECSLLPLVVNPPLFNHSYSGSGTPGLGFTIDSTVSLFKTGTLIQQKKLEASDWKIWISVTGNYIKYKHEMVAAEQSGSDTLYYWVSNKEYIINKSLSAEAALLIPVAGIHLQLGGGLIFKTVESGGSNENSTKKFVNITGKILKF